MWRYNGSGISGFTQQLWNENYDENVAASLKSHWDIPPLFLCKKKDAASWIRDRTIDQTNKPRNKLVCVRYNNDDNNYAGGLTRNEQLFMER